MSWILEYGINGEGKRWPLGFVPFVSLSVYSYGFYNDMEMVLVDVHYDFCFVRFDTMQKSKQTLTNTTSTSSEKP
jgi:hypothetical protein